MKVAIIVALFAACAFAASLQGFGLEQRLFADFMRTYNKHYTAEEFDIRFENFKNSLKEIERRNKFSTGATYNITKFADMSREEFRKYPCGVNKLSELNYKRPNFTPVIAEPEVFSQAVPVSWDWVARGAVTPVKDQQQCGSCWAFSTIGNAEGVWHLAGNKLVGLSEEQIVSCSTTDYGCEGGWPFWALTDMLASPYSGRLDTEKSYPYTSGNGDNGVCNFKTTNVGATLKSYKSYCTENTAPCAETDMQQLLITYGPLSVCLDAGPMQYYTGGVDNPQDCDPDAIDHCVTMVGYGVDNGTPFWRIKNSWNTNWGEQGYYRLIRGTGACGINKVVTIASTK
jgi:C1A family cysteine protease